MVGTPEKITNYENLDSRTLRRFVEDHVVSPDACLVCDDLGDEWADYIAADTASSPPRLQFIHCKHGLQFVVLFQMRSNRCGLVTPITIKNATKRKEI